MIRIEGRRYAAPPGSTSGNMATGTGYEYTADKFAHHVRTVAAGASTTASISDAAMQHAAETRAELLPQMTYLNPTDPSLAPSVHDVPYDRQLTSAHPTTTASYMTLARDTAFDTRPARIQKHAERIERINTITQRSRNLREYSKQHNLFAYESQVARQGNTRMSMLHEMDAPTERSGIRDSVGAGVNDSNQLLLGRQGPETLALQLRYDPSGSGSCGPSSATAMAVDERRTMLNDVRWPNHGLTIDSAGITPAQRRAKRLNYLVRARETAAALYRQRQEHHAYEQAMHQAAMHRLRAHRGGPPVPNAPMDDVDRDDGYYKPESVVSVNGPHSGSNGAVMSQQHAQLDLTRHRYHDMDAHQVRSLNSYPYDSALPPLPTTSMDGDGAFANGQGGGNSSPTGGYGVTNASAASGIDVSRMF